LQVLPECSTINFHSAVLAMNDRPAPAQILIIDDDVELGAMLSEFLAPEHMAVTVCLTGEEGLGMLRSTSFNLVILDVMMPGMNGIDVLKELRRSSDIPVIMLTAKGDDIDRILGLEFGADDYLAKPFNPRELLARLRAILRRSTPATRRPGRLSVGTMEIDVRRRSVKAGSVDLRLTGTEFEMLRCLAEANGDVVTKEVLSQQALGRRYMPYDRSIDTHVSNLRGKLARAGVDSPTIQSRRGVGYCLITEA
jgi:DNA-binding response OmpR family regulator